MTFTVVAPIVELACVMATVAALEFAFAGEAAVHKAATPDVASGALVAPLAVELVMTELAAVQVAIRILEAALAVKLAVIEGAGVRIAFGVGEHTLAVGFALFELALEAGSVTPLQFAQPAVLALAELTAVFQLAAF